VTDQPKPDEPSAALSARRLRHAEEAEARGFFQLIPRRDLTKIALLVVLLVVVVALQRRSGAIIDSLTRSLSAPAAQVEPKEPPRVKLAPIKKP
jgi:hypothetical protein